MLRLTLAQMRLSLGRLTAAGIAIVIGTAFVAATLVAGAVMTRTTYDAVSASYADADLVVSAEGEQLSEDDVARLAEITGVEALDGRAPLWVQLSSAAADVYPEATVRASHPRLEVQELVEGDLPDAPGGVALPAPLAERLQVGVGDTVTLAREVWTPTNAPAAPDDGGTADGDAGSWTTFTQEIAVTGLTEDPTGGFTGSSGAVVVHPEDARGWLAEEADAVGQEPGYRSAVVVVEAGSDPTAVATDLADAAPGVVVRTKQEQAALTVNELTGGEDALTAVVLAFAAVALLVAALVIANTFQVLVAQRTRTLALLRCVGADRGQVRRSVLVEAAILGLTASVVGVLVGLGLTQVTLSVVGAAGLDVPLPDVITVTPAAVLVPVLVGTAVTLAAALAPARAATRVAPLAALRPVDPVEGRRAGRARLALATLLAVGGGLLLTGAALAAAEIGPVVALAAGVLGGAVSFVGVLVGAAVWAPAVARGAGRLLGRAGPTARLAAANTVRNPRRTAATSSALLIGVTLVAMMSTGAASARTSLAAELDAQYPVDLAVAAGSSTQGALDPRVLTTVGAVDGVDAVAAVSHGGVELRDTEGASVLGWQATAVEPTALTAVLRASEEASGLTDDTVIIGSGLAASVGISDGDELRLAPEAAAQVGAAADAEGASPAADDVVVARAVVVDLPEVVLLTPATLEAVAGVAAPTEAWVRFADDAPPARVVADVQDALSDTPVIVSGAALERVRYEQVVDAFLAVVVGLLGAAVVIAVIGVANTLSLSVLERRRESATLRSLGLTRGRLRGSLAVEGVLIAAIGATVGAVLGLLYGWAGAATVLGSVGPVTYEVPWLHLGLVLVSAVVAGLLASVLPGRAAARTSPVRALAVE
ncbi:ABC transporter permease [Actinotalea sp. Marseille-Q4924]|uniref:ABC transporter permease n=1 Tax=Actinotalea sp. Marseille-Q4924 TaxID=2866571 RepID=UPI001CE49A5D|nr:ABC transporter permease [Actinotalea sp. Marseille-Q4924]